MLPSHIPVPLKNINFDLIRNLSHLPERLILGTAPNNGDCFFYSVAQHLNQHFGTNEYTVQSLRLAIYEYYNRSEDILNEINRLHLADYQNPANARHYREIQFDAHQSYTKCKEQPPIWGRPHIEGMLLCRILQEKYNHHFFLTSLEFTQQDEEILPISSTFSSDGVILSRVIDAAQNEQFHIVIVLSNIGTERHFVPALSANLPMPEHALTIERLENPELLLPSSVQNQEIISDLSMQTLSRMIRESFDSINAFEQLFLDLLKTRQYTPGKYYDSEEFNEFEFIMHRSESHNVVALSKKLVFLQEQSKNLSEELKKLKLVQNNPKATSPKQFKKQEKELKEQQQRRVINLQKKLADLENIKLRIATIKKFLKVFPLTQKIHAQRLDVEITHLLFAFKKILLLNSYLEQLIESCDKFLKNPDYRHKNIEDLQIAAEEYFDKLDELKLSINRRLSELFNINPDIDCDVVLMPAGNFPIIKLYNNQNVICVIRNSKLPAAIKQGKFAVDPRTYPFARNREEQVVDASYEQLSQERFPELFARTFYFNVIYSAIFERDEIAVMNNLQDLGLENHLICLEIVEYIEGRNIYEKIQQIKLGKYDEKDDPLFVLQRLDEIKKSKESLALDQLNEKITSLQILYQLCCYMLDLSKKLDALAKIGIAIQDIKATNLLCVGNKLRLAIKIGDLKTVIFLEDRKNLHQVPFKFFSQLFETTDGYVAGPRTLLELVSQGLITSLHELLIAQPTPFTNKNRTDINFLEIGDRLIAHFQWIPTLSKELYNLIRFTPENHQSWYSQTQQDRVSKNEKDLQLGLRLLHPPKSIIDPKTKTLTVPNPVYSPNLPALDISTTPQTHDFQQFITCLETMMEYIKRDFNETLLLELHSGLRVSRK